MNELYAEHPVMFKNNPVGFIVALLLVPVFGAGLIILLSWHIYNKSSTLKINENEISYEKGILSKERAVVNMGSVRTTKIKQTFFNRIFGVGTIEIYTSGDTPEIIAPGFPDPIKVSDIIKSRQSGVKS